MRLLEKRAFYRIRFPIVVIKKKKNSHKILFFFFCRNTHNGLNNYCDVLYMFIEYNITRARIVNKVLSSPMRDTEYNRIYLYNPLALLLLL